MSNTPGPRWLSVYEGEGTDLRVTATRQMAVGARIRAGREGDVLVGVRSQNRGISRSAAEVTATPTGWQIEVRNRNGAVLHPWGQPSQLASTNDTVNWPLVGIRLQHTGTSQHWVLLSAGDLVVTPAGPVADDESQETDLAGRPNDLSPGTREALGVVFEELLCWPPRHPATPLQLKRAATRLRIAPTSVRDRLTLAWDKAASLGVSSIERELTDPAYLHALVRGGYLTPPRVDPGLDAPSYIPSGACEVPHDRNGDRA